MMFEICVRMFGYVSGGFGGFGGFGGSVVHVWVVDNITRPRCGSWSRGLVEHGLTFFLFLLHLVCSFCSVTSPF